MQVFNMNELNYDLIDDIYIKLLPCELELLIRGLETYMFIFHNIYSQHNDTDEEWTRDYIAMNLYNKLAMQNKTEFKTGYAVFENCENHSNASKKRVWNNTKNFYKKSA